MRLREAAHRFKKELLAYRLLARDPRTPRLAKWLLLAAVAFVATPFHVVLHAVPLLGLLEHGVVLLLLWVALRLVPAEAVRDCRARAEEETARPPKDPRPSPCRRPRRTR